MTDEELIAQLEQGALEDLSPAVVDLIQSRLAQSARVRTALVDRLHVEQYLAGAIGADNVSRDDVLARSARLRPPRTRSKRAIAVWITSLAIASVALVFAARPFMSRKSPEATARANRQVTPSPVPQSVVKEADATELEPSPRPDDERRVPSRSSTNSGEAAPDDTAEASPKPGAPSGSPPRPLADVMFEDIGLLGAAPRESELRRWFTAASGQAHRFTERMVRDRRCGFFDGWIKLRDPWPADGMLRLGLTDHNRLRLHFYHGGRGITLTYFEGPTHTWTAYAVSRATGEILPQSPILVATDEGRGFRSSPTGAGPIDIAWRDGELRMSRGDVPLLTASLAGLPDEVYFEGHAGFRGLAMVRVEDVPPREKGEVVREHPVTGDFAAAKEKWRVETPTGALFTRNDDGSVELTVAKTTSPAWASWKLPRRELCEIVLDLDEATPGSGVYVADEQGRPQDVVRFFRDSRTGQTTIAIAGAPDARSEQVSDPNAGPISFVSPRSWLKLVVGCGILRVWVGPDGRHWAPAVTSTQNVPAPFATLGLYCKASESRRGIRLRRIEIRELAGLTRLVEDTVRARAAAIPSAGDFVDWLKQVDSRRPNDIDSEKWRRACALATLGHGANPGLGMALLATLLDDVQAGPWPIEARLAALNDAALVANTWDNHADALLFLARYRRLGQQAFEGGESRPYSLIRPAQMQSPWLPVKVFPRPRPLWHDAKSCKRCPTGGGRNWTGSAGR